ncbi:TPA: hypothetical protein HA278_06135 [Candidatus Woesearchaeota archaeon]|nr:hypothetical protein [Candidatus Woesearchaeota archaeon]
MNLSMIGNYLKAKWSKGITGKKIDVTTKDIRLLSCFGDGENVKVCPGLRPSFLKMGKFICGECGCGDKPSVFLNGENDEYTKLDHPYLACPRHMPGFSDYSHSESTDGPDERKVQIEMLIDGVDPYIIKPTQESTSVDKKCPECEQRRKEIKDEAAKNKTSGMDDASAIEAAKKAVKEKYKQHKTGCSSCAKNKQLKEEARKEALAKGYSGKDLETEITRLFNHKLNQSK